MNDIRLAHSRPCARHPVVTIVAVASLALGIGAQHGDFLALINSLMFRTLPVAAPDRLAMLVDPAVETRAWSNPLWEQIRDAVRSV